MTSEPHKLKVYFDGSCALCRAEIGHYRKMKGSEAICFLDVSDQSVRLEPDINRQQVMKRFHVRCEDGSLKSGAAAFVSIWGLLPRWRSAFRIASLPGFLPLIEIGYRMFLPFRPMIATIFASAQSARTKKRPTA